MDIREAIANLVERKDLTEENTISVMDQVMTGEATPAQVAALLTALRMKGETIEEVTGAARVMRQKAVHVHAGGECVLDTCGTGGDQKETFNISTVSAFVVAGAGVTVAKHGNRSVSSQSGSADVLGALGVKVDVPKEVVEQCLEEIGIGFLFAPLLHGAMKYAVGPRREIGIRTIFNLLGPLTNPADATHQLVGVYDRAMTEMAANVLKNLGSVRAMVVHGEDGLDEISLTGPTFTTEVYQGRISSHVLHPEEFGFTRCSIESLKGGKPEQCAATARAILRGAQGPMRDIVLLNSAAALYVGEKVPSIDEGIGLARESIDSGRANEKLERLVRVTNAA